MAWDTWYLEDNQVKTWIINSVSSNIQPLILRKKTARDMWVILEHMCGQKKRKVCVYQLMRDVYSLRQGTRSVAEFYAALKSKWEDLDYHSDLTWKCPQDQLQYMTKEWENRVFLFLSGLNDDYENIRSQILNSDESFSIEDVYARVEAEEQRKLVSGDRKGEEQSAFVNCASVESSRSSRKCTHCKKLGHTVDFCWDLHPEKKNGRGRPSGSKQPVSSVTGPGDRKASFSAEQLRELRAYLSQVDGGQTEKSDDVKGNQALAVSGTEEYLVQGTGSGYGPGPMGVDTEAGSSQHVRDLFCDRVFPPLLVFLFAAAVSPCAVACSSAVVGSSAIAIATSGSPPLPVILPPLITSKIDTAFDTGSNTKSENLPVQVTSIWLNKDNYLSWSAALEIGITSRGRLSYITGEKPAPSKTDLRWATWALEDSQVKVWIISSVSADIQPLILRKSTAYDMWTVLARMYGRKKRVLRTYQIKRSIYSLKQGDLSVASFFAALKTK
ncbi:hypothetical protein EJ110_NYTH09843 [Nymphaea thermarum]|nr:hypothetical protein EJ110_NYTH09843 [Nymphaea thermarum]